MDLTAYLDNQKLQYNSFFPFKVRDSAQERITRHSFKFSSLSALVAYSYHAFGNTKNFAFKQMAKCFGHKLLIGFSFFYVNQLIWAHSYERKQQDPQQKQYRLAKWPTYALSSLVILPLSIATQFLYYRRPPKKIFIRSLVEVMTVCLFSLFWEKEIERKRNKLLQSGWCAQDIEQVLDLELNKSNKENRSSF